LDLTICFIAIIGGGAQGQCQLAKLIGADASVGDTVSAVAIDGGTLAFGAVYEDLPASNAGAAYVFALNGGVWMQVAKLSAADSTGDDYFGIGLSMDGGTIVVGALDDGAETGAAYVFQRDQGGPGNWGQVKKLVGSDSAGGDKFGYSVSISGDTAIAGAYSHDLSLLANAGAAYVHDRHQGGTDNWGEVKKLVAPDAAAGDNFGWATAIDGDCTAVGALNHDEIGGDSGAAYIYCRDEGGSNNWGFVKKLVPVDASSNDLFGTSVSMQGDTIVVGALFADGNQVTAGASYVFQRNAGGPNNWGQACKLQASDGVSNQEFGRAVAVDGDVVVIGASRDNFADDGAAYIFRINQPGPNPCVEQGKIISSDLGGNDKFGHSVALSGSMAVVRSYLDDNERGADAGSAYVFFVGPGCIPTLSEWGMMAMAALVLSAGGVVIARCRAA
jgi:hypothetical protein